MTEPKRYELTTIKDIFDTVPVEKMADCLNELGVLMVQAKGMHNAMSVAAELVSGEKPACVFEWPEPVTWIDDDKGEITANYVGEGLDEPLITMKTQVSR